MRKCATTITPMLLKSRSKDGKYQVVIRINHHGRYYLNIGNVYACACEWDENHQRLRKKYPNAEAINKLISDKVYEIEQRMYQFISVGKSFTAKELCSCGDNSMSVDIDDVVRNLSKERNLTPKSIRNYCNTTNRVKGFIGRNKVNLNELDSTTLRRFGDWMRNTRKLADGTIQISLAHIASMWNYCISKRILSRSDYPMDEWNYLSTYHQQPHHISLTFHQMLLLESYYTTNYLVVDQASACWNYKNPSNHISLSHCELYISLYLIGYRMQGLALADLLSIRKEQLSYITKNGISYMVISGLKRQKTGVSVEVVVEMDDMCLSLLKVFIDTIDSRDGWLFPIYYGLSFNKLTDDVVTDARAACGRRISRYVSSVGVELNKVIDNPSERFPSRITYYSCRHTFATLYMERGSGNISALASMLGHNVASTTNYVKELRSVDALIESKGGMFG